MSRWFCSIVLAGLLAVPGFAAVRHGPVTGLRLAPRKKARRRTPPPAMATPDLPRKWRLPRGWRTAVRDLPSGGLVEYVSGLDARMWARLYSWPISSQWDGAQDARDRLSKEFDQKAVMGTSSQRRGEVHMTLWGFTDEKKVKEPDIMMKVRCVRHGDRLMAAIVGIQKPEDRKAKPDKEVEDFFKRLQFVRAPRLAWGAVRRR